MKKPAVREVMDEFRQLVQILRTSHRAAEDIHVTGAQLFVLTILGESDVPMSIRAVAQQTQTDPSTVSVVVGRLVERGLVRREQSREDARRTDLSLTAKGRALRKRAPVTVAQKRLADALTKLSDREIRTLGRTLASILSHMGVRPGRAGMMFDE
jgi:DNA-binding MarR family transcriptional regulator